MKNRDHAIDLVRSLSMVCLAAITVASAGLAANADEDWRKLQDFKGPKYGAPFRLGAPLDPFVRGDSPGQRETFDASGVQLGSWIPLNGFPGGNTSGNDCWGYVSPSGREYAIVGLEKGFGFVEVTDPTNAQVVGYIAGATSLWHDVKVHGHYAYGVSEGGLGIQVMDMSQIDNGIVTLVQNKMQAGHTTTHNIAVNSATGYLYLVGANIANGGLVAVSTADPANPTIVGSWSTRYVHDAQVVSYTSGPLAGREIAYCFNGGAGIEVIDVTNKASMVRLGGTSYPGVSYCHQGWMSEDGMYLYMDDELDEGNTVSVTTTRVFSLANPSSPTLAGTFTSGKAAIDHNLYVKGNRIYEANYRSGLRIFDRTNPVAPVEVAYFDSYPGSDSASFNGAWSVYPFFPSGTILVSDIERGLFVLGEGDQPFPSLDIQFSNAPTMIAPGQTTSIVATIDEISGEEINSSSVTLHYTVNGGSPQQVAMTQQVDDSWRGVLPALSCFDAVNYRVSATAIDNSPYTTASIDAIVATDITTVFEDDMETNKGWTIGMSGDNATTGVWTRVDPNGTAAAPEDDHTPAPGIRAYVTGQGSSGGGVGDADVDGGTTTLLSPVINLAGSTGARISYWRWYSNNAGADPFNDTFVVQVTNNGTSWVTVETVGPSGDQVSGGWFFNEFEVSDFVSPTANVRVRFRAADLGSGSIIEAGVDDFKAVVIGCTPPPACAADYNGDTTPDVLDFLDFFDDFGSCSGQPAPCGTTADADFNGDTFVDVLDFLDFLDAFGLGC